LILRLFKKKKKKKPEPTKPNPPPWDVPLDQTTAAIIVVDNTPFV
jgi:hypothetical protein